MTYLLHISYFTNLYNAPAENLNANSFILNFINCNCIRFETIKLKFNYLILKNH